LFSHRDLHNIIELEPAWWTDQDQSIFSKNMHILEMGGKYDISNGGEYGEGERLYFPYYTESQYQKIIEKLIEVINNAK
jgi:hypothetical protein